MWLRLSVVLAWCASAGLAIDWKALKPQGCLSDFAGVIDPSVKAEVETYCHSVEQAAGVQLDLVTIRSLEGEPLEDVASVLARGWGIGQPGGHPGVLLLLAIQDRRSRLEISPELESGAGGLSSRGLNGSVLREMRPALRQQQYGEAMMAAAETAGTAIAEARKVRIDARLPRHIRPGIWDSVPWPLVAGVLVLLVLLMRVGGPRSYGWSGAGFLPWLVFGNRTGRSTWGSRGSGGFGGYDSGDAFGGFGGGDFGGCGASSDW